MKHKWKVSEASDFVIRDVETDTVVACVSTEYRTRDQVREIAALVAAAPEMLEALEAATQWIGKYIADDGHNSHIAKKHLEQIEAVINKAKGGAE